MFRNAGLMLALFVLGMVLTACDGPLLEGNNHAILDITVRGGSDEALVGVGGLQVELRVEGETEASYYDSVTEAPWQLRFSSVRPGRYLVLATVFDEAGEPGLFSEAGPFDVAAGSERAIVILLDQTGSLVPELTTSAKVIHDDDEATIEFLARALLDRSGAMDYAFSTSCIAPTFLSPTPTEGSMESDELLSFHFTVVKTLNRESCDLHLRVSHPDGGSSTSNVKVDLRRAYFPEED